MPFRRRYIWSSWFIKSSFAQKMQPEFWDR